MTAASQLEWSQEPGALIAYDEAGTEYAVVGGYSTGTELLTRRAGEKIGRRRGGFWTHGAAKAHAEALAGAGL